MMKLKKLLGFSYLILSLTSFVLPNTHVELLRAGDNYPPVIWKLKP